MEIMTVDCENDKEHVNTRCEQNASYHCKLFTLQSLPVTLYTTRLNIHKSYVLPTQCIYVFCVDLRTNSDYFTVQH
jgi:hypothetical protein